MRHGLWLGLAVVFATASRGAEGVRLRYKLAAGEVLRYREKIDGIGEFADPALAGAPVSLQVDGTARREWRVERVGRGPLFVIDSQVTEATLRGTMGDQQEEQTYPRAHLLLEMTDTGQVARVQSRLARDQTAEPLNLLGLPLDPNPLFHGLLTVGLPDRPVEPGTTWLEEDVPLRLNDGSEARAQVHTRLKEMKPYQGQNCAEIDAGFETPIGADTTWEGAPVTVKGKMTGAMTIHFAPERGVVIHAVGTLLLEWTLTWPEADATVRPEMVAVKMKLKLETNLDESPLRERRERSAVSN
jgi:hypothetical protein